MSQMTVMFGTSKNSNDGLRCKAPFKHDANAKNAPTGFGMTSPLATIVWVASLVCLGMTTLGQTAVADKMITVCTTCLLANALCKLPMDTNMEARLQVEVVLPMEDWVAGLEAVTMRMIAQIVTTIVAVQCHLNLSATLTGISHVVPHTFPVSMGHMGDGIM